MAQAKANTGEPLFGTLLGFAAMTFFSNLKVTTTISLSMAPGDFGSPTVADLEQPVV